MSVPSLTRKGRRELHVSGPHNYQGGPLIDLRVGCPEQPRWQLTVEEATDMHEMLGAVLAAVPEPGVAQ